MEQLILIGVIVAFSILEAVARRQKQRGKGEGGAGLPPVPEEWGEERESPGKPRPVPSYRSYDEDPSFDDAVEGPDAQRMDWDAPLPRQAAEDRTLTPRSSEDLIPRDIWEEIAALARGERPTGTRPQTKPAPRVPPSPRVESVPQEVRVPAHEPAPAKSSHPIHDTHPNFGRPVAERLTSPARRKAGSRPGEDVKAVRRLLAGGGTSLRQAVILHEILGPPASQREDPRGPT